MTRDDSVNLHKGQRVHVPLYGFTGTIKDVVITKTGRDVRIEVDGNPIGSGHVWINSMQVELIGTDTISPLQAGRAA
jgi:hypothetical protein